MMPHESDVDPMAIPDDYRALQDERHANLMTAIGELKGVVVSGFGRVNGRLDKHDDAIRVLQLQSAIDQREDAARVARAGVSSEGEGLSFKASPKVVASLMGAGGLGAGIAWLFDFFRGRHL